MIGRTRWRFREVASTQDVAWHLAATGASHGTVVRADYQLAGRGRQGRRWEVPANTALMFSVLLRPDMPLHQLGSISIQFAMTLCEVFERVGAHDVAVKWPNDVLIGGLKVSGILVQTRMMPDLVAVAGVGINVSTPVEALPPTATSLETSVGTVVDSDVVFNDVLAGIDRMWANRAAELTPARMGEIDDRLWLNGQHVTLLDADREITGTIAGISSHGGLRLIVDGIEQTIYAGEITRGPRPIETARQH